MATVVMFVILRLSLGCHFLYEGVWKIKHSDTFSAAPFLSEAKGPISPLFYAMLPDIEGRERLGVVAKDGGGYELAVEKDEQGNPAAVAVVNAEGKTIRTVPKYELKAYLSAWSDLKERAAGHFKLSEEQKAKVDALYDKYATAAREFVADNEAEILAHFNARERFEKAQQAGNDGAAHQQEREWKRERELRKEVGSYLAEIENLGKDFQSGVWNLLEPDQKAKGRVTSGWNPFKWQRTEQINFAVTWALTLIGLCLITGFFTRLAALGGGGFMFFVVLTQPAWPGLYPPDPAVVGHALLINKDFVEMVALFLVATSAAGRWAGLDYFVHHLLVRPFLGKPMNPNT